MKSSPTGAQHCCPAQEWVECSTLLTNWGRFGARMAAEEFSDLLIHNQGCIALRVDTFEVELRIRPDKVKALALSTGLQHLLDVEARRHVEASQIKGDMVFWLLLTEIFARSRQAIQHICTLVEEARMKARVGDFLLRPRQRRHLAVDNPLKTLLDVWVSGTRDVEQLVAIADRSLNGRYIVAAPGQPNGDLCIMVGGRDFNLLGQDWLSRVPPLCIEDWPDVAYGRWVAQSYREAWRGHEPRLDDLDCFIDWPRIGRRRHGYGRLILPCLSASGSRALLGAMRYDSNIDLRAGSRTEVANEPRGRSNIAGRRGRDSARKYRLSTPANPIGLMFI